MTHLFALSAALRPRHQMYVVTLPPNIQSHILVCTRFIMTHKWFSKHIKYPLKSMGTNRYPTMKDPYHDVVSCHIGATVEFNKNSYVDDGVRRGSGIESSKSEGK